MLHPRTGPTALVCLQQGAPRKRAGGGLQSLCCPTDPVPVAPLQRRSPKENTQEGVGPLLEIADKVRGEGGGMGGGTLLLQCTVVSYGGLIHHSGHLRCCRQTRPNRLGWTVGG